MKINCKNCNASIPLKEEVLKKYTGKLVSIKCPSCHSIIKFKVRPADPEINVRQAGMETTIITGGKANAKKLATKAVLKVLKNQFTSVQAFSINSGKNTIGRLSNAVNVAKADIAITTKDNYMSKVHCMIEVEEHANGEKFFILSDCKSTNGTFFEDKRMEEKDAFYLNNGDSFRIGRTTILIEITHT